MAFNFNNNSNEYSLYGGITGEMINLYGFGVTYIRTTKVNPDVIFQEIQNLRADNTGVFNVQVYPENTQGYDAQNDILSKFGVLSFDSINLYISASTFKEIYPNDDYNKGISDLIVFPSQKIFEIVDIENQTPGVNNMFVYKNQKNVYILKCKPYNYNRDEIQVSHEDIPDFSNLFNDTLRDEVKAEQDTQASAVVVKNVDDVFGDLG